MLRVGLGPIQTGSIVHMLLQQPDPPQALTRPEPQSPHLQMGTLTGSTTQSHREDLMSVQRAWTLYEGAWPRVSA